MDHGTSIGSSEGQSCEIKKHHLNIKLYFFPTQIELNNIARDKKKRKIKTQQRVRFLMIEDENFIKL